MTDSLLPAELVDRSPQTCYETEQKIVALRAQFKQLRAQGQGCSCPSAGLVWVTCPCGSTLALYAAFKCAECGFYLCKACARRHFDLDMVANISEAAQAALTEATHG